MKNRWIARLGSIGLVLAFAVAAHGFEADFDPSTYNPAVAELVNFEVCEPCLGGDDFTYSWDFDGDGTAELETDQSLVTYSFASEGFHSVILTVRDAGGRTSVAQQGIVVGDVPAFGIREILQESDGALFVLLTVIVNEFAPGVGIEEGIPSGWSVEIVDAGGALTKTNMDQRQIEAVWMSIYEPGESVSLSYRLRPAYTTVLPPIEGAVAGFFDSVTGRYVMGIAGMLTLPR